MSYNNIISISAATASITTNFENLNIRTPMFYWRRLL